MVASNEFNRDSLVWKQGMTSWTPAGTIDNLKDMFPPVIPQ